MQAALAARLAVHIESLAMPDPIIVATQSSWLSRLGASFRGVVTGLIFKLAGIVLLFWNEVRARKPNQSPDSDYSEVYIHMFGAPKPTGSSGAAATSDMGSVASQAEQTDKFGKPCSSEVGRAVGGLLGMKKLGGVLGSSPVDPPALKRGAGDGLGRPSPCRPQ